MNADLQLVLPDTGAPERRRPRPPGPVLEHASYSVDRTLRHALVRLWSPSEPMVAWLLLHPRPGADLHRDRGVRRITTWSYRAGYGGLVVFSLYPFMCRIDGELIAWRDHLPLFSRDLQAWMNDTVALIRQHRCRTLVLATGSLDRQGQSDFQLWRIQFRSRSIIAPRRWLCIGTDEEGWPMAPAVHGRPAPPEETPLVRWKGLARPKHPPAAKTDLEAPWGP